MVRNDIGFWSRLTRKKVIPIYKIFQLASAIFHDQKMSATRIVFQDEPEKLLEKLVPLMEKQNLSMLLKQNMRGGKNKTSK